MNQFNFNDAPAAEKVYFEKVVMEVPGGAVVLEPEEDLAPTTPLKKNAETNNYSKADSGSAADAILGAWVYKGQGDQLVKIVLGGVVRKATAVDTTATLNGSVKYV